MNIKSISGLLNPIRMKVIMSLIKHKKLTTKEMSELLPSVSQASLYRHVKALLQDEFIEVIDRNQVRGSVQKTYQIKQNPFEEMQDVGKNNDLKKATVYFYTFAMTLLGEFADYASKDTSNMVKDSIGFSTFPMNVTKEENKEFINELETLLTKYIQKEDTNERIQRKFSFVYMPVTEK